MRRLVLSFGRSDGGNFAIIAAILAPMLAAASLTTIDLGRMAQQGLDLQDATDAATFNLAKIDDGTVSKADLRQSSLDFINAATRPDLQGKITLACVGKLADCTSQAAKELAKEEVDPARSFYIEAMLDFEPVGIVAVGGPIYRSSLVTSEGTAGGSGPVCLLALQSGGNGTFKKSGSASLVAPGCNIVSNSSSSESIQVTGSGSLNLNCAVTAGGYRRWGSGTSSFKCGEPLLEQSPVADPHADLIIPTSLAIPYRTSSAEVQLSESSAGSAGPGNYKNVTLSGSGRRTLGDGDYYVSGKFLIQGSGNTSLGAGNYYVTGDLVTESSGDVVFGKGNYYVGGNLSIGGTGRKTLGSGTYHVGGKLTISDSGNVVADGVVFVLADNASMAKSGSGSLRLTAPKTGDYAGFAVAQSHNNDNAWQKSDSGAFEVTGIVYAPAAPITISGSGGATSTCVRFIGATIEVSGSGGIRGDCQEELAGRDLILSNAPLALAR